MRLIPLFLFFLLLGPSFPLLAKERDKFLDIKEITTSSGITAWLVEDHSLPLIALEFAFENAGAKHDPEDKQGLTRLVSNTMDEGAGELDALSFQDALRTNSIDLSFNASRDTFGGSLKTRLVTQEKAVSLLKTALTQPRFEEEALGRMRDANMARIRSSLSDPEWAAARLMNHKAFAGHPYATNSGGTLTTLPNIARADLQQFVQERLARQNLRIAIVGALTPDQVANMIEEIFGSLPEQPSFPNKTTDLEIQNKGQKFLYETDIPQSIIQAVLPAPQQRDADYYAFMVMNQILGAGGFGSRLTEEIREKRGLTYGIYTYPSRLEHVATLNLFVSTANANAGEVLDLTAAEMQKMRDAPVSTEELENAVSFINGSLPLSLSSTDNIAALLLNMQLEELPIDYLDSRAAKYEAVTLEDVQQAAQKYLIPDHMTTILVGQPEGVPPDDLTRVSELPNVN